MIVDNNGTVRRIPIQNFMDKKSFQLFALTSQNTGKYSIKMKNVTIPNSVTSIGDFVFYGCSGLKKVIVKDIAAQCEIKFVDGYSNL